ncbi:heme ABC exporter ATP-binding protein CcmA [Aurantimonas sp. VKM B-3413]|uniref:heme ABC exporter ATP-binding protein CcmA n=1 Tax=Aurantimonas sp. VKM B-3413 TaxID=2779401 RepID=UPI001E391952|nr:heme ABC exporter ATP-binding protein CcmA [Aurantimonas sp. VKM B-3413]
MSQVLVTVSGLLVGRGSAAVAGPFDVVIRSGAALLVTGPNGAGKSTLLRTLAGLLRPISGTVSVEGALAPDGEAARHLAEACHYVGHRNAMKPSVAVGDNLAFWARFLGGGGTSVTAALEAVGLPGVAHLPFAYLSAGQQRRASLARLLVAARPVWILDEPTSALDSASQARFAGLVDDHRRAGGIAIAATHQPLGLEDAESLSLAPGAVDSSVTGSPDIDEAALDAAEGWL